VQARQVQADTLIDDILEIADDTMNDWVERENQRTGQTYIALNDEAIARSKLRVDLPFHSAQYLMDGVKPGSETEKQMLRVIKGGKAVASNYMRSRMVVIRLT
jgi:hypothetical protein